MQYQSAPHLKARFGTLPPEIRDIMSSIDSIKMIESISKKYSLHIDQIGELADETWLVMLGVTKTSDFIGKLSLRLKIDRSKAGQIATDINDQLFLKIRDSLKKVHEEKLAPETSEKKVSQNPAPPLPEKNEILQGIENPELATLAGDSVKKTGMGLSTQQADILKGIENPTPTTQREYVPPAVAPRPISDTSKPEPIVKKEEERVVPLMKMAIMPKQPLAQPAESPFVYPKEPGGPVGEGRLPTSERVVEQKTQATFRMPPKKTEVKQAAPQPQGVDPYREATK